MDGTIKNVNADKKYFFINGVDGIEYFSHKSLFKPLGDGIGFEQLAPGMHVVFEAADSSKGPRATGVQVQR